MYATVHQTENYVQISHKITLKNKYVENIMFNLIPEHLIRFLWLLGNVILIDSDLISPAISQRKVMESPTYSDICVNNLCN
jgi:hypothetical protein